MLPAHALSRPDRQRTVLGPRSRAQPAMREDVDSLAIDEKLRPLGAFLDESRRDRHRSRFRIIHAVPELQAKHAALAQCPVGDGCGRTLRPTSPAGVPGHPVEEPSVAILLIHGDAHEPYQPVEIGYRPGPVRSFGIDECLHILIRIFLTLHVSLPDHIWTGDECREDVLSVVLTEPPQRNRHRSLGFLSIVRCNRVAVMLPKRIA